MSNVQATQVKITLPNELYLHLKSKADKFGLNLASYIRHLVINDVKDVEIPVFKMSEKRERIALKALEDYKNGRTKVLDNIDKYLDNL
jgi:predicted DNA-binding protein